MAEGFQTLKNKLGHMPGLTRNSRTKTYHITVNYQDANSLLCPPRLGELCGALARLAWITTAIAFRRCVDKKSVMNCMV